MKLFWKNEALLTFSEFPLWTKIAMPTTIVVSLFALFLFMAKSSHINSGEEFAKKYIQASQIKVKNPVSRFVWYAPIWPQDKNGHQILPYSVMKFKGFLFLMEAMFWIESSRWKNQGKKWTLWLMFIIRSVSTIFALSALYTWLFWVLGFKEFQNLEFIKASFYLLTWSFALSIIPAIYLSIVGAENLYKMDISIKDRDAIMLRIKLLWLLPLAITLFEPLKLFTQFIHYIIPKKTKNK